MSEKSFWQFSLATYSITGVEGLLLRLQDEFGADVNMLLCCYWLGSQQITLTPEQWIELDCLTADWREGAIVHLRSARRFLKGQIEAGDLRQQIQAAEIEAERFQQNAMEKYLMNHQRPSQKITSDQAAWQNIQRYFTSLQAVEWIAVETINNMLHQSIVCSDSFRSQIDS